MTARIATSVRTRTGLRCALASGSVLCLVLAGCAAPASTGPLRPTPNPPSRDVPIPGGFRLVDRSSEDWSAGSVRYVRHRYTGPAEVQAVREFFRREMPLVRWAPIRDSMVGGRYTLRFERAGEECTVTLEHGRRSGSTVVEVLISPKPDTLHGTDGS